MNFFNFFSVFFFSLLMSSPSFASSSSVKAESFLYETLASLDGNSCGAGTCWADLSQLTCTWANEEGNHYRCSYKSEKGDLKRVRGKKAKQLTKALQKIKKLDVSCGMGTCGFRFPQDVTCAHRKGYKKHPVVCSVHQFEKPATTSSKIPVPTSKPPAPASR